MKIRQRCTMSLGTPSVRASVGVSQVENQLANERGSWCLFTQSRNCCSFTHEYVLITCAKIDVAMELLLRAFPGMRNGLSGVFWMDSLECQTSTAAPAEPGGIFLLRIRRCQNRRWIRGIARVTYLSKKSFRSLIAFMALADPGKMKLHY